ncbi:glycosyltransferase family 39 protein [Sphingobacterium mizutaii]|uniref:glycosyltransferase family 39 protein n=1 Tax=Sphingobacterium mizutaii TaxID=1010 RepID=UPI0028A0E46C|nr:glycosyltransferase family 39 protein [Sphingobacterium mizutaii]
MTKTNIIILIGFIVLKFILQYSLVHPIYDLQRDEFLHLDQANHLAWGFQSVPPMTSWISLVIKFLGNGVFWIRFFPALFGALTILLVWKTIEELKGNLFALLLGTTCVTFSVYLRLNTLYQPNSLDVLCWTSMCFFLVKYLNRNENKWLIYLSLAFAVGFLNKYNILFLVMGLVPAFILVPERKIFTNRILYLGILLAFILVLPNIIWQYRNDFPVLRHMKELSETQLVHVDRWGFIRSQLMFFPGTYLLFIIGLYGLVKYPAFKKYRVFFWTFFFVLAIFLFFKAKDYYALGLYPIYFAFGSFYLSHLLDQKAWAKVLKPAILVLSFVLFLPLFFIAFPNKTPEYIVKHPEYYRKFGMLRWEDGKEHQLPQDFADMLGWSELARKVDSVYTTMPEAQNTLVLCDNYGQAGAINYYSKLGIQAVSFNADYLNWFDLDIPYKNIIRIKNAPEVEKEFAETAPYFEKAHLAASIENQYAREYGTGIFSFIGAKLNVNERIRDEIEEEKSY